MIKMASKREGEMGDRAGRLSTRQLKFENEVKSKR